MSNDDNMRASDRDRERATGVLRDAYAVGRLDLDEFLERTDAVCSARTWGELHDLIADLPERHRLIGGGFGVECYYESVEFCRARKRPCAALWVVAAIWLAIAAAAHVAAAIPLVLLAVFMLCAARRG
jgi:hypothetical protein